MVSPEKLVAGGASLSRLGSAVVFVEGLYPGDVASAIVERAGKSSIVAVPAELIEPSPLRRVAPCPVALECGGCDWTSLRLDAQLDARKSILLESLIRTGGFEEADLPALTVHPSPLRYRLRGRLHFSGEGRPGFFARRSNRVVPVPDECELLPIEVIESARAQRAASETRAFFYDGESVIWGSEAFPASVSLRAGRWRWSASTAAFLQANRHLLTDLVETVLEHARAAGSRNLALDLYGGVGFFAIPLTEVFEAVYSVEGNDESSSMARINGLAATDHGTMDAVTGDVEEWLTEFDGRAEFVLVDPPRGGLSSGLIEEIDRIVPDILSYLSCDPVTFARDAALLAGKGWKIDSLDQFDLFPNTHHVETLGRFSKR
ncbi:MAG: hypothetical protein KY459_06115 [Acidobacteria bacterium]|nr:hypothetical protein [Acidobacteriota bacterium]